MRHQYWVRNLSGLLAALLVAALLGSCAGFLAQNLSTTHAPAVFWGWALITGGIVTFLSAGIAIIEDFDNRWSTTGTALFLVTIPLIGVGIGNLVRHLCSF